MKIAEDLKQVIQEAVKKIDDSFNGEIKLEHPADVNFGDYSTNVAMSLAKAQGKNPRELARLISESIDLSNSELIERIDELGIIIYLFTNGSNKLLYIVGSE
jgi:arginyl-tRNA synthetase